MSSYICIYISCFMEIIHCKNGPGLLLGNGSSWYFSKYNEDAVACNQNPSDLYGVINLLVNGHNVTNTIKIYFLLP